MEVAWLSEWPTGTQKEFNNWLARGPGPLKLLLEKEKAETDYEIHFLISQRNEEHSALPSQPISLNNSCPFQNSTLHAIIVQHACMRWGRRNRFGVQFRLEMCLSELVSFTSAPGVIALVASQSYSEDWNKFWFSIQLRGLIALQNIMHCYKYTRIVELPSHACISKRRLHSKRSNPLNCK